ncbi:autotransporter domain-containing protein [Fusobacterium varium]|uniref:autotransporter domain-containing protein n=1 Tax=Fusobacterium varium TaxID=856 RepID=UPI00356AA90E
MIKEMEKALKRYLKGKNRITMGVVVAFLLGSSFAFGDVTIKYENSTLIVQDGSGTNIGTVTKNSADEFIWTLPEGVDISETVEIDDTVNANNIKVNIVNNGNINSSGNQDYTGNGILSHSNSGTSTIGNITNNGTISGSIKDAEYGGNGVFCYSETSSSIIGNIINYGSIIGSDPGAGSYTGNGIFCYSETSSSRIRKIENYGIISGSANSGDYAGNGIYSYSNLSSIIENIINYGSIRINTGNVGHGIHSLSETSNSTIRDIKNYGVISVNGYTRGNGIYSSSNSSSSTIGNITNNGIIIANNRSDYFTGNAIFSFASSNSIIGNTTNYGIISGNSESGSEEYTGCGISSYSSKEASTIGDITNYGSISGSSNGGDNSGNGIFSYSTKGASAIGDIKNYGIISGNSDGGKYSENGISSYSNSGSSTIESISNSGVIMGERNGIYIGGDSNSKINDYNNYGLIIGQTPVEINGIPKDNSEGQGMAITLESDGSIKTNGITSGTGVSAEGYSIINTELRDSSGNIVTTGAVDTYTKYTNDENISNSIINGAGVNSGTVTIEADKNFSLNGGIINAYKTAVTVKDGASFTGTNVTINGGGLDGNTPVISGSAGANTVNISGNSFINGKVDLGDGDDILSIGNSTQINGDIDGGTGTDTLNFGSAFSRAAGSDNINLFHKISNVENININQKVTAFETSEIKGADKINIGKNGELVLRIDGTNTNKHALSGNTIQGNNIGTIDSEGGKLLLALNGVSDGSTINMGIKLGDGIYGVENPDIKYRDLFTLETTSYLHSISKTSDTEVKVETKSTLPLSYTNYYRLNKIYQSLRAVDGIKEFNVDTDEKFSSFIGYLNDIYAGNPYSYSSELSRKSMRMFRDIVTENSFKADTGKWMIYGGLTHIDGGTKDTYYGKGYYTYDIGSSDIDSDTKITGAYMLGEYGVSDDFKAGVAVGGNKLKSDLSNDSKVDGDALYIGGYVKKYLGNLKVTAGAGFQYGDYDADRLAINNVASDKAEPVMKYSDNYNDISYDIYLNGRYSHNIGDNLYLEPYGTLSYTYVKQDGADEGNKTLAIETDSKSFDYTSAKVGLDLKKVIPHEKGKSTLSLGVSYTRLLNGADEEYITGRFKGGSDFDILVAHKNEHSLGLNVKYALELKNGILFDVKGSYAVERDSHNQSGKNKTKGEWIVGTGLGYKF